MSSCTRIDPYECCQNLLGLAMSARFVALPPTGIGMLHALSLRDSSPCGGTIVVAGIGGECISNNGFPVTVGSTWTWICANGKRETRAVHRRACGKRSVEDAEIANFLALSPEEKTALVGECKRSVHPDEMTLSDGTVFNISSGVPQADIDTLVDIAISNPDAGIGDVPEDLHRLVKTE